MGVGMYGAGPTSKGGALRTPATGPLVPPLHVPWLVCVLAMLWWPACTACTDPPLTLHCPKDDDDDDDDIPAPGLRASEP